MKTLHDQTLPELQLWQQNFLLLNNLVICAVGAETVHAAQADGLEYGFLKAGTLESWRAQYKTRRNIFNPKIWSDEISRSLKHATVFERLLK